MPWVSGLAVALSSAPPAAGLSSPALGALPGASSLPRPPPTHALPRPLHQPHSFCQRLLRTHTWDPGRPLVDEKSWV